MSRTGAARDPRVPPKRLIVTADDFGLSEGVNEAVERAHRDGILTAASLMVAGPAVGDAVRRARRLPDLRVGLHLVVVEGPAVLPPVRIPDLVDAAGQFPGDQFRLGLRYACHGPSRRQLAAEVRAQYEAFAATGLPLDHADAHKHMHLHPVVGHLLIRIGAGFRLRALRVPAEPPGIMAACGVSPTPGARALHLWTRLLRAQARRAGLRTCDSCFGLAWTGHLTAERLRCLLPLLPPGLNEVYTHPASRRDDPLPRLMPGYEHEAELAALLDPDARAALSGVRFAAYGTD